MAAGLGVGEFEAAVKLVELAHKQGWLDKLLTALRKKHHVLVLGCSGTGKTALVESLTADLPSAIDRMNRTEFIEKHAIRVAKHPFVFTDTPGQSLHKSRRVQAVREALKRHRIGAINVVSYGYHESRITRVGNEPAIVAGAANEAFLQLNRDREIEALGEWTEILGDPASTNWLITVVTKADLWWNQQEEVLAYYSQGPYARALGAAKTLHPVVVEYCSVFQKFYKEAPMSGDFQDTDRARVKGRILRELLAAVGKTKS
jgi:hypothetical protein